MPAPSKRKVYVAILTCAVGAWALDRFMLGGAVSGPSGADAALLGSDLMVNPTQAPVAATLSSEQIAMARLADQLRAMGVQNQVQDHSNLAALDEAFRRPPPVEVVETVESAPVVVDAPQVTAVLTGQRPAAIVNGKTVPLAGEIDGWTVAGISEGAVVFARDGMNVERRVR
ncbi:MAG: hypothetical protein SGJ11_11970 [Phycisphaerae bacterium]|nr:hypothetical protein [Phycisphaerae bacterium]